jgi:hypothetical protein
MKLKICTFLRPFEVVVKFETVVVKCMAVSLLTYQPGVDGHPKGLQFKGRTPQNLKLIFNPGPYFMGDLWSPLPPILVGILSPC